MATGDTTTRHNNGDRRHNDGKGQNGDERQDDGSSDLFAIDIKALTPKAPTNPSIPKSIVII